MILVFTLEALVVKLVDAPDSKSGSARSAGSSPARGTTQANVLLRLFSLSYSFRPGKLQSSGPLQVFVCLRQYPP
jgi:hypothetical protein